MRVLLVADPHIPIPPLHYGGSERIVHLLCDGFRQRGCVVDLIAAEGSQSYGGRLFTHRAPSLARLSRAYRKIRFQLLSLRAARVADVVVSFARLDYLWTLARTSVPLVVVFENPAHQFEIDWIAKVRTAGVRFVGVSRSQMAGLEPAPLIDVIHNAADAERLGFSPNPADPPYFAFLGRLTANKGVHLAIEAARIAGVRLVIAGNVPEKEPGARAYFDSVIRPELGPMVEWIGPVDNVGKARLLQGATALLFPIQWAEPFGLVMAEALACGCPVIGWRNGSVREVIEHGMTGFVVESVNEMAGAIGRVDEIERIACRRAYEERFSAETMVDQYLRVIEKVACT
jgi:glycosyltransferase involved in cell wall biosynthesis